MLIQFCSVGAFIFAQESLRAMTQHNNGGTLLFAGATASMKSSSMFAAFAPAKFATRALAQSLAREYGEKGIHVAHVIVDGKVGFLRISCRVRGLMRAPIFQA